MVAGMDPHENIASLSLRSQMDKIEGVEVELQILVQALIAQNRCLKNLIIIVKIKDSDALTT